MPAGRWLCRVVLALLNGLILIFGITVIILICVTFLVEGKNLVHELDIQSTRGLVLASGVLAVSAVISYTLSLVPCPFSKILVILYCTLLGIKIGVEIWGLINLKDARENLSQEMEKFLHEEMAKYPVGERNGFEIMKENESGKSKLSEKFWDTIQKKYDCCGVNGPQDWLKIGLPIPQSCCNIEPCIPIVRSNTHEDGCLHKFSKHFKIVTDVIFYTTIVVFIAQVAAFVLGFFLIFI